MSGSLKWFVYTTDNGTDYALYRDESLVESVNAGVQDYATGVTIPDALPRNIKPRKLIYESVDGLYKREVVALTLTIYNGAVAGSPSITDAGVTMFLRRLVGEVKRLPFAPDTGIIDGDLT